MQLPTSVSGAGAATTSHGAGQSVPTASATTENLLPTPPPDAATKALQAGTAGTVKPSYSKVSGPGETAAVGNPVDFKLCLPTRPAPTVPSEDTGALQTASAPEPSTQPSASKRRAKGGPRAEPTRRARVNESNKVTERTEAPSPKRPASPSSSASRVINPPISGEGILSPPTPKRKNPKGRGPCKGRTWSIRTET
ncbi:hypothetical protein BDZ91DRAFT_724166 [Kalaharituber pfeilii]|nr:hypothetical protein BDZ91DRAFT_724166 [Kalaharituber pfeilii]